MRNNGRKRGAKAGSAVGQSQLSRMVGTFRTRPTTCSVRRNDSDEQCDGCSSRPTLILLTPPWAPGPSPEFQHRRWHPRGGDDEGRRHTRQLRLPGSEPRADGLAVPEKGHRPGHGPGAPGHHRPGLRCSQLHGKHCRVHMNTHKRTLAKFFLG